ncbi:GNAT family N-acetyltransferase [Microlunatus endophyticus]|uniref:GNAT family N-acetyltransferase n=1 Tax=Microlunatus endophyticus TaxID=1716077 RepID=A0A917W619_9ACTN|nr:GNAT family N-acetyltransferase [Microlunatus endophyticus]
MTIRPLRAGDDEDIGRFHDLHVETERGRSADATVHSLAETIAVFRRRDGSRFFNGLVAEQGGELVGQAMITGSLEDNLRFAYLQVSVPPRFGGRGVGRALADAMEAFGVERGRTELLAPIHLVGTGADRSRRFAEARGYQLSHTEIERRLSLPLDPELLDRLDASTLPKRSGYRVGVFVGPIPQAYAAGYCEVANRLMIDAPHGDLEFEASRRTPESLVHQEDEISASGRTRVTALALAPDDQVAGYCCCVIGAEGDPEISQWGTIVHPDHRGHRLGMAMKVAAYRRAEQLAPGKEFVVTDNAETNRWMIDINVDLGFQLHSTVGTFVKTFATTSDGPTTVGAAV